MELHNRYQYEMYAQALLNSIICVLDRYGIVTVADVIDLEKLDNPFYKRDATYSDNKLGWINLNTARVVEHHDGSWSVVLPKPLEII